jgi:hypothetical protein
VCAWFPAVGLGGTTITSDRRVAIRHTIVAELFWERTIVTIHYARARCYTKIDDTYVVHHAFVLQMLVFTIATGVLVAVVDGAHCPQRAFVLHSAEATAAAANNVVVAELEHGVATTTVPASAVLRDASSIEIMA